MITKLGQLTDSTIFKYEGRTYKKGSWKKGWNMDGETTAHPKLGGKFQEGQEFEVWFSNSLDVEVSED